MRKRDPIITEFAVQVHESGHITYDGLDEFLWWLLHRGAPGGFEAQATKLARFGLSRRPIKNAKGSHSKRA